MKTKDLILRSLLGIFIAALYSRVATAVTFKHIIVIIQENRTPDNLFGSNPTFEKGVDIQTTGVDSSGNTVQYVPVALDGCYDINHDHRAFEHMLTAGSDREQVSAPPKCKVPAHPQFGYADNSSGLIQPYFDIASQYGWANRMFQTNEGPSFPAHQFLFGGTSAPSEGSSLFVVDNMNKRHEGVGCTAPSDQSVRLINGAGTIISKEVFPCFERRTLADVLEQAKIGWRYYASKSDGVWVAPNSIRHICKPSQGKNPQCVGELWTDHVFTKTSAKVLTDISKCDLQGVSWVVPSGADSDHAGRNTGGGPSWVASIVNAVGEQASCGGEMYWQDTAIFVLWDDWGGWNDHIRPFQLSEKPDWGAGYTFGFRVPLLTISAYTPAGMVSNDIFDFGSVLHFIETNFGLRYIGDAKGEYDRYADFYAAKRGDLSQYFSLTQPRSFTTIQAPLKAKDFIDEAPDLVGPDDE